MAMLYALLKRRDVSTPHQCFIEGVDLDSMKLEVVIPIGSGYPRALAASVDQQRIYVTDSQQSEVRVYDTAGPLLAKVPFLSPPYDCALTASGDRLIVSTFAGLAAMDTSELKVDGFVAGPYPSSPFGQYSPEWLMRSAAIALSPDGGELAAAEGAFPLGDTSSPPNVWLVNPASLSTMKSFAPPPAMGWLFVYDVAFCGDSNLIMFRAASTVVALDVSKGKLASYTQLDGDTSEESLNTLTYSAVTGRAYVASGYIFNDKVLTPFVWAVDPVKGGAEKISGFIGSPGLARADDDTQSIFVAAQQLNGPDRLARVPMKGSTLQPSVYTFSSQTHSVAAMQIAKGSVYDPTPWGHEHSHAEQSVEILIGLTGGGSGWVVTPHGIIKPVDPAPIHSTDRMKQALGRVLRAATVARSASAIPDARVSEQVRNQALVYAKQQLASMK